MTELDWELAKKWCAEDNINDDSVDTLQTLLAQVRSEGYEAGRQAERAAVVAWLGSGSPLGSDEATEIAKQIERGDHVNGET